MEGVGDARELHTVVLIFFLVAKQMSKRGKGRCDRRRDWTCEYGRYTDASGYGKEMKYKKGRSCGSRIHKKGETNPYPRRLR